MGRFLSAIFCALLVGFIEIRQVTADSLPPPLNSSGISGGGHAFTVRKQTSQLCDAGSTQWTGTVKVSADKSLFFCKRTNKHPSMVIPDERAKGSSKAVTILRKIL
jgi:hypothetical protein